MSIEKKIKPSYWNKIMVKKIKESREVQSVVIQPDDKLRVSNGCLSVNGKPYVVERPDEPLHSIDEDGKLVTRFRGHLLNHWDRSDIQGY